MTGSLYEMAVFSKVVAAGSLSAAARDLGVSTAVVSRRLAALEARGLRVIPAFAAGLDARPAIDRFFRRDARSRRMN